MQISTIGIELAKTVFQIHAVDADGTTLIRKRLRRAEVLSSLAGLEPCRIGMEACATSHCRLQGCRRLHRHDREDLEEMGHHHVAKRSGRLVERGPCAKP